MGVSSKKHKAKPNKESLILLGTYRTACKGWIQTNLLYNIPIKDDEVAALKVYKTFKHLLLLSGQNAPMEFDVTGASIIDISGLEKLGYEWSGKPHAEKYVLLTLAKCEAKNATQSKARPSTMVFSIKDFARSASQRKVVEKYLKAKVANEVSLDTPQVAKILPSEIIASPVELLMVSEGEQLYFLEDLFAPPVPINSEQSAEKDGSQSSSKCESITKKAQGKTATKSVSNRIQSSPEDLLGLIAPVDKPKEESNPSSESLSPQDDKVHSSVDSLKVSKQVKSKQRVADHGEVFTADREVKAMVDLVKQEAERVDSRFLEPACGDGNFLAEILRRKLEAAKKRATPPRKKTPLPLDYEKQAVIAIASIYGVDLLIDNVITCRERLFEIWDAEYTKVCQKEANEQCREAVRFILSRNIVCGNALSLKEVDQNGNDTEEPIVFSEWTFISGTRMQRKDYRFDKLLAGDYEPQSYKHTTKSRKPTSNDSCQEDLFNGVADEPSDEGEFLTSYVADYRRIHEYGR